MQGRDQEGRKKVKSALDNAVAEWNTMLAKNAAQRVPALSTADKKRKLPEPPSWWNDDNASTQSIAAARQLASMKGNR